MLKNKALRSLFSLALNYKTRRQYSSENTNIGSQANEIKPKLQNQILSLQQFIIERNKNKPIALFESRSEEIFVFGINPLTLRNRLFVFFKYNYWQKNMYGEDRLIQFCTQLKSEQLKLRNIEQDKKEEQYFKRLKLVQEYQRQLATLHFPHITQQIQFSEHYVHILSIFLDRVEKLTQFQMYFIFDNLERIVVGELIEKQNQSTKDLGWLLVEAFNKFVNKIDCYLNTLSPHYKSLLISLAKSLRSSNVRLLQYIKITLQNDKKQLTMHYFLSGLCLLAINNTFPYEYFYKNKQDIMNYLQSAQNLSGKKVLNTINMLQIFSRKRLMYCEKIIDRLLICIQENLVACDITQVSKIFFYYSKLKCSIKNNLVAKIVERIYIFMDILDEKTYSFIIKAISNLNYQDNTLIQALKYYNYELFLSIIKYNSENSGDFYRKIIQQVELAFKADRSRYFAQQDQTFTEKGLTTQVSDVSSKESLQTSTNLQT